MKPRNGTPHLLDHWLHLCGLDLPDSNLALLRAASEDFNRHPELRHRLADDPETFLRWWHRQDYQGWHLTLATAGTDWAWLVLARAGAEVTDSRFGGL